MSVRIRKMPIGAYYWVITNSHGRRIGSSFRASSDKGFIRRQARMMADRLDAQLIFETGEP